MEIELHKIYVLAASGHYFSPAEEFLTALKPAWDRLTEKYADAIEKKEKKEIRRSLQFEVPGVKPECQQESIGDYPVVFIASFPADKKGEADAFWKELMHEAKIDPAVQGFSPQIHSRRIYTHQLDNI